MAVYLLSPSSTRPCKSLSHYCLAVLRLFLSAILRLFIVAHHVSKVILV